MLDRQRNLVDEATRVAPELKVLFPEIKDIALAKAVVADVDNEAAVDTVDLLMVNAPRQLNKNDVERLQQYMEVRLDCKEIRVMQNPASFPWKQ